MAQVNKLLDALAFLKKEGLSDIGVAFSFFVRRIHPLKDRVHLAFEYTGANDPSCETSEDFPIDDLDKWVGNSSLARFGTISMIAPNP
ncbi:hypothetical protein E2562_019589 [Oryza meyeriana var. granulata]|uniref:Uncharacterized protein n=1 Tax=Oryza meyeriana var. granulata TaxID=110450 RepID=A0A6G1EXA1_9ORYZ|nr:hypothetical protein E2562_019589 [Oryza meyeriana var. granulata]